MIPIPSLNYKEFNSFEIEKKAEVLGIFFQIDHNNPFINNLKDKYNIYLIYYSYQDGPQYFANSLRHHEKFKDIFGEILNSIENLSEKCRFNAIVSYFQDDFINGDFWLTNSKKFWNEQISLPVRHMPLSYAFNILKTKIDVLIFYRKYEEAVENLLNDLSMLEMNFENESLSWLKFQYTYSLISLSKKVELEIDLFELSEKLEELRDDIEFGL